jgi:hypothetical protein
MSQLFQLIGEPITVPITVGFSNLTSLQRELAEDQSWGASDFCHPECEPFFEFLGLIYSVEKDLGVVNCFSILGDTEYEYQFREGSRLFGIRFIGYESATLQEIKRI